VVALVVIAWVRLVRLSAVFEFVVNTLDVEAEVTVVLLPVPVRLELKVVEIAGI